VVGCRDEDVPALFFEPADQMHELDRRAAQGRFVRNKQDPRPVCGSVIL
jgi:hypothetical protein